MACLWPGPGGPPEGWAPSFHVTKGGMETTLHPTSLRSRLLGLGPTPHLAAAPHAPAQSETHHQGGQGIPLAFSTLVAQVGREDTLGK